MSCHETLGKTITTWQTYSVLCFLTAPIKFVKMPSECSAVSCKSGYDSNKENQDGITFHKFPLENKGLLNLWLRRISRIDFVPTRHSKLCSRHFKESDFLYNMVDTNKSRWKRYKQDQKSCDVCNLLQFHQFSKICRYIFLVTVNIKNACRNSSIKRRVLGQVALNDPASGMH